MTPTLDPNVMLEEHVEGYSQYRNREGLRWAVVGKCKRLCMGGLDAGISEEFFPKTPLSKPCCGLAYIILPPCRRGSF